VLILPLTNLLQIVQLLLSYEADITIKNYNGESALEVASPAIKQIILDHADHGGASYTQRLLQGAWLGNHNVVNSILVSQHLTFQFLETLLPLF